MPCAGACLYEAAPPRADQQMTGNAKKGVLSSEEYVFQIPPSGGRKTT
jgi:hypothetical protein